MKVEDYQILISSFIEGKITVEEFEEQYLTAFKAEPEGMNPTIFKILDQLFADIDAYSPGGWI